VDRGTAHLPLAGNFIYIAASDLVPEIKTHPELRGAIVNFAFFSLGIGLMLLLAFSLDLR
jgi:zinc and cadmium transporter